MWICIKNTNLISLVETTILALWMSTRLLCLLMVVVVSLSMKSDPNTPSSPCPPHNGNVLLCNIVCEVVLRLILLSEQLWYAPIFLLKLQIALVIFLVFCIQNEKELPDLHVLRIVISRRHISVLDLHIQNCFICVVNMDIWKIKDKIDIFCAGVGCKSQLIWCTEN